jgi:hypothetical protein
MLRRGDVVLIRESVESYLFLSRCQLEGKGDDIGELIQKAAGGDSAAVGEIFVRYQPDLLRVAKSRARQVGDAEDAVQDVFLKLSESPLLKTFQAKVEKGQRKPREIIATLKTAVINQLKNVASAQAKRGMTHRSTSDVNPASGSIGSIGHSGGKTTKLSKVERDVVKRVLQRTLKQANLSKKERRFIELLVVDKTGGIKEPGHGMTAKVVNAIGLKPSKGGQSPLTNANRVKERFLKLFCKDRELRDLLPTGHARAAGSSHFRKDLKAVCEDEEFWPVIEFAAATHHIDENLSITFGWLTPDSATDLVLSWIRSQLTA